MLHESEHVALMRQVAHIFVTVNKLEKRTAEWHVLNMTPTELQNAVKTNGRFLKVQCECSNVDDDMCSHCYGR